MSIVAYGTKKGLADAGSATVDELVTELRNDMEKGILKLETFCTTYDDAYVFDYTEKQGRKTVCFRIDCSVCNDNNPVLDGYRSQGYKVYYLQLQDNSRTPSPTYANVVYTNKPTCTIAELIDAIEVSLEGHTAVYIDC